MRAPVTVELSEPFPVRNLPRVWTWLQTFRRSVADDFAPKTLEEFVDLWTNATARGRRSWVVRVDQVIVGMLNSDSLSPVVRDIHCVFRKDFWGRNVTKPALAQAIAAVFAEPTVQKISTFLFFDNGSALDLARSVGFQREGVLRDQGLRDGKLIDVIAVGLTRKGWNDGGTIQRGVPAQQHERQDAGDKHEQPQPDAVPDGHPGAAVQHGEELHPGP